MASFRSLINVRLSQPQFAFSKIPKKGTASKESLRDRNVCRMQWPSLYVGGVYKYIASAIVAEALSRPTAWDSLNILYLHPGGDCLTTLWMSPS